MKNNLLALQGCIFTGIFYVVYLFSSCEVFDDEFKVIQTIHPFNKNYQLKIYHIPSNASSQSYIQLRKVENGAESVLESYERFDTLYQYTIRQDTLILSIGYVATEQNRVTEKKFRLP